MKDRSKPYKLIHRKGRYIQVVFEHIPGRCFSSGCTDDYAAQQWADAKVARDTGKLSSSLEKITLGEFAKDFFKPSDPKGFRKRNTARGYSYDDMEYERRQGHLDNYILRDHGMIMLDCISDVMIEDWIVDLKNRRTKKPLSNDTKNKILASYSDVMREAKRLGFIRNNPCDSVRRLADNGDGREPFTEEELELFFPKDRDRLLFIWEDLMWAVYFMILKDTGFRPGEVAGLSVRNFFPELHGVFTTGSVHWHDRHYRDSVKTSRKGLKFRAGFLSDQTMQLLQELIRYNPDQEQLFLVNGNYMWTTTANDHLRDAAPRAHVELGDRTQYSFRHSFQSFYLGRMPEIARLVLMGHTHTRQEYTHLTPEQTLQRVLSIDGVSDAIKNR